MKKKGYTTITVDFETVAMVKKILAYWSICDDLELGKLTQGTVVKKLAENELKRITNTNK